MLLSSLIKSTRHFIKIRDYLKLLRNNIQPNQVIVLLVNDITEVMLDTKPSGDLLLLLIYSQECRFERSFQQSNMHRKLWNKKLELY